MPFETAQIPNALFATGWTNHQIILNRCKTDAERLFYMLYAGRERLENKGLIRVINTDTMNSLLGGKDAYLFSSEENVSATRRQTIGLLEKATAGEVLD